MLMAISAGFLEEIDRIAKTTKDGNRIKFWNNFSFFELAESNLKSFADLQVVIDRAYGTGRSTINSTVNKWSGDLNKSM